MAFLSGLNGGNTGDSKKAVGSSRFLGGIRRLTPREQQVNSYKAEAERAQKESTRINAPGAIAMETLKGIPSAAYQGAKMLVDEPVKTLATPVLRGVQGAYSAAGAAIGGDLGLRMQEAANQPMNLPSPLGGSAGVIEPQRAFGDDATKQIAGEALKYGATIYTGGRAAPLVGTARGGLLRQAAIQGAKEGAVATGAYMGGEELARKESTLPSVAKSAAIGTGLGGFLGGVLGLGGAALARPYRTVKLPVQDLNEPTLYHGSKQEGIKTIEPKTPLEFATRIHKIEGQPSVSLTPSRDLAKAYTDPAPYPEKGIYEVNAPKKTLDLDSGSPDAIEYLRINKENVPEGMFGEPWITTKKAYEFLKSKGYDSVSIKNNPYEIGAKDVDKTEVRVFEPTPVRPGVNIRRFQNVPVKGTSRTTRVGVQTPYTPDSELPIIKAGTTPKTRGVDIDTVNPPDAYAPAISTRTQESIPKTVKVWVKSKFSNDGAYSNYPVIRKVDNVTLYHGGEQGQFWTPDKKYAAQFGKVKEKTGSFYQIDNGNRMTDVFVEVKPSEVSNSINNKSFRTEIGVTSFRGTPVKTVAETKSYYNTSRAKGFKNNLKTYFKEFNLPEPAVSESAGYWEGSIEPSFIVKMNVVLDDKVRAYAATMAQKANQDAVIIFAHGKGSSTKYTFKTKNPDKALAALNKEGISGATVDGKDVVIYDIDGSLTKNVAAVSKRLKSLPTKEKGHGELIFKDDYAKYTKGRDSVRTKDGQAKEEVRFEPIKEPKPKVVKQKTEIKTPVTMDIPKQVATVKPNPVRKGQAITTSNVAKSLNEKLVEEGFDAIPEEQLAKIGSINKKDQVAKVSKLLDDPQVMDMVMRRRPIPDGVAPQVLFNSVMNKAVKENDFERIAELARSPILEELSTAGQTLGSAGFNREALNPVEAIRQISAAREETLIRRGRPSNIKQEVKNVKTAIKKVNAKRTWDEVINSLTC